jgi:toxin YoeB
VRTVSFQKLAFEQFTDWAKQNPKLFGRLVRLVSETARDPFVGIGKPEPLKGNLKGHWSRRIDEEHRLIYCVTDTTLTIVSCRDHYR